MKRKTIIARRSRRRAKGSSYAEKKKLQFRGIFNADSPFKLTDGNRGVSLNEFRNLTRKI